MVVCPLSTARTWQEELAKEGIPDTEVSLLLGSSEERWQAFSARRKWNIINFEGLLSAPDLIREYHWNAVVLDESTRIRNPKAKTTRLLVDRLSSDRRCILSGYPAPEGPLDYFEQFKFLHGQFCGFDNFWRYRNIAFTPIFQNYKWVPKHGFKDKIRNEVQRKAFVLSRKDVGLANEKIYQTRYVSMTTEQARLMKKLEEEFVLEMPNGETKTTMFVPVKLLWMARLAGGYANEKGSWFESKFEELKNLLTTELSGEQVVVWFRFNAEIEHASRTLEKARITHASINGATDEATRAEFRKSFHEGKLRVLLLQQKVGMFGLDLSCASTAIYFSNGYSSENRRQSEDRIEHPLKREQLLLIDLVTEDTVDEDIAKILQRKEKVSMYYLTQQLATAIRRRNNARLAVR